VFSQVSIRGIQIRLVIARMRDGGLQVIGDHDLGHATEKLPGPHMRTDPVPQILPGRGLGEGVTAGTQHRHEHGGGVHLAALRVMNWNGSSGIIHEHLFAGAVLLAQHQVEFFYPPLVEVAEAAYMCCNTCQPLCGGRIYVARAFESHDGARHR